MTYLNQGYLVLTNKTIGGPEGERNIKNGGWILLYSKKIHVQALT